MEGHLVVQGPVSLVAGPETSATFERNGMTIVIRRWQMSLLAMVAVTTVMAGCGVASYGAPAYYDTSIDTAYLSDSTDPAEDGDADMADADAADAGDEAENADAGSNDA